MSRTFTKFLFAVAMLFGLLNTTFAETLKYKATMEFSGSASGSSKDVDAEISKEENGSYTIVFKGFSVSLLTQNMTGISATISVLEGTEGNGLVLKSTKESEIEFAKESLSLSSFDATIDANGKGSGTFEGSTVMGGILPVSAACAFTLEQVIDNDTIVTNTLDFDNVPFYNRVIDLTKEGDTTNTNNDSTAVGIKLYSEKAAFAMSDFEIAIGKLALKQRMVLEGLSYAINDATGAIAIKGNTFMHVDEQNTDVPAVADIVVSEDGTIDGTIDITVDMVVYKYRITVIFGKKAEGVVIETKTLSYNKTKLYYIKSDNEFVFDTAIYYNNEGLLIENIKYSIVDQNMSLLIKDLSFAKDNNFDTLIFDNNEVNNEVSAAIPTVMVANKAEAYIDVKGETVYLKDIDIDLSITLVPNSDYVFGHLTIIDGGPATNEFIDMDAPIAIKGYVGRNIVFYVDTTGNGLDGNTADTEFRIGGVYDYADGEIEYVKIASDLDEVRNAAIKEIQENGHGFEIEVVATDAAGNSTTFSTTCYAKAAPTYIDEIIPELNPIRVAADTATGIAIVKFDSLVVTYVAKNSVTGESKEVAGVPMQISNNPTTTALPTTMELTPGNHTLLLVWDNPFTGENNGVKLEVKVYESLSSLTGVSSVANKQVSVYYKNGNLVVNGAKDANVSVVNISGATVYTGKAGAINLHNGIYFVKVDGKVYKIIVK